MIIHPSMLWNRPGEIIRKGPLLSAKLNGKMIPVYASSEPGKIEVNDSSYYNISLKKPVYLSTGGNSRPSRSTKFFEDR